MIVKESAVSQKNNLMNKILLFLLGGCIIGSAITIFSAQNKHKKIPTQQNAESKQNTQQEDRISTSIYLKKKSKASITKNIIHIID